MNAHDYTAISPYNLMACCIITRMDFIIYPYSDITIMPSGININALLRKGLRVGETSGI
jgi:hypothetical protein